MVEKEHKGGRLRQSLMTTRSQTWRIRRLWMRKRGPGSAGMIHDDADETHDGGRESSSSRRCLQCSNQPSASLMYEAIFFFVEISIFCRNFRFFRSKLFSFLVKKCQKLSKFWFFRSNCFSFLREKCQNCSFKSNSSRFQILVFQVKMFQLGQKNVSTFLVFQVKIVQF